LEKQIRLVPRDPLGYSPRLRKEIPVTRRNPRWNLSRREKALRAEKSQWDRERRGLLRFKFEREGRSEAEADAALRQLQQGEKVEQALRLKEVRAHFLGPGVHLPYWQVKDPALQADLGDASLTVRARIMEVSKQAPVWGQLRRQYAAAQQAHSSQEERAWAAKEARLASGRATYQEFSSLFSYPPYPPREPLPASDSDADWAAYKQRSKQRDQQVRQERKKALSRGWAEYKASHGRS
jgi:hypothetical protein